MKFRRSANPEYAKAIRELRRSNASGIHADRRTKRARTRQAKLAKALRDTD